ncbi:MAG: hypothetical protein WBA81_15975, partial [Rhodococcus sp. (in: high G+C Gram-positive bacteria)]
MTLGRNKRVGHQLNITSGLQSRDNIASRRDEEVKVRDLRVVGLEPDGQYVVCADPKTGDK